MLTFFTLRLILKTIRRKNKTTKNQKKKCSHTQVRMGNVRKCVELFSLNFSKFLARLSHINCSFYILYYVLDKLPIIKQSYLSSIIIFSLSMLWGCRVVYIFRYRALSSIEDIHMLFSLISRFFLFLYINFREKMVCKHIPVEELGIYWRKKS